VLRDVLPKAFDRVLVTEEQLFVRFLKGLLRTIRRFLETGAMNALGS
jgi:hypothetical protein